MYRWRVKFWLAVVKVAEPQLRAAYEHLVDVEQQDQEEGSS